MLGCRRAGTLVFPAISTRAFQWYAAHACSMAVCMVTHMSPQISATDLSHQRSLLYLVKILRFSHRHPSLPPNTRRKKNDPRSAVPGGRRQWIVGMAQRLNIGDVRRFVLSILMSFAPNTPTTVVLFTLDEWRVNFLEGLRGGVVTSKATNWLATARLGIYRRRPTSHTRDRRQCSSAISLVRSKAPRKKGSGTRTDDLARMYSLAYEVAALAPGHALKLQFFPCAARPGGQEGPRRGYIVQNDRWLYRDM